MSESLNEQQSTQLDTIFDAVLNGKVKVAVETTRSALQDGVAADEILHGACVPAMDEVGCQFEAGDKFVPEMLVAAHTMAQVMALLKPHLVQEAGEQLGTVLIGTVAGDVHDIGKNLVAMMLEGAGFQVVDLGVDVEPDRFVEAVREHQPQIVGLSALLSTTMPALGVTIRALEEADLRKNLLVMVGGAPVSQGFADQIGADGYAADAGSAPRVARQLLGK
jgi:methylmalonyl-CoA mutase cobalamin-binding domain/chain